MELILFVFKTRIKFYFTGRGSGYRIAGLLFFSFFAAFYGYLIGSLLDQEYLHGEFNSVQSMLKVISTLLLMETITRAYLPSYKPRQELFSPVFPLTKGKKYLLDLMVDFIYPYFFVNLVFLLTINSVSSVYSLPMLAGGIILLFSAHIIRRIIQILVERSIKVKVHELFINTVVFATALFFIIRINITGHVSDHTTLIMGAGTALMLAGVDYILSSSVFSSRRSISGRLFQNNIFNNFSSTFIFRNRTARKALLVAFLLKVFILAADFFFMEFKNKHLFNSIYLIWGYASPLILYSYLYSNTWGFYRNLWLAVDKSTAGLKPLLKVHLKLMAVPFLADFIISAVYFVVSGIRVLEGFLFYLSGVFFIQLLSIYASVTAARAVEKPLSFRANSSYGFRIAAVGIIAGLLVLTAYPAYFWIVLPVMAASLYPMSQLIKNYPRYKYDLYHRLFKSSSF